MIRFEKQKLIEFEKFKKSIKDIKNKSKFTIECYLCKNSCKQEKKSTFVVFCPLFKMKKEYENKINKKTN